MAKSKENNKRLMIVSRLLFIIYMAATLYILLMSESFGRTVTENYRYNLNPFSEIKRFYYLIGTDSNTKAMINIFGNIICFLPFGLYEAVELENKKFLIIKVTLLTFFFSLCVETVQLYFRIGIFDVDDLILNTAGGFLGGVVYRILWIFWKRLKSKEEGK